MKKLTSQQAYDVLSSWIALEVLSPQSFKKPEDLVGGEPKSIVFFDEKALPWENGGEKVPKNKKLFYQIVLGTFDLQKTMNALTSKYGDKSIESPTKKGESVVAIITVDQHGYPLAANNKAISLSSFSWGIPKALNDELENLSNWNLQEEDFLKTFDKIIRAKDQNENPKPLDKELIKDIYSNLLDSLKIPTTLLKETQFAIKCYESLREKAPKSILLNSFYLEDLVKAKSLLSKNQAPSSLLNYLGIKVSDVCHNILEEDKKLESILAPYNMPLGRWPGPGRHPLVLLQQGAVNVALSQLKKGEILAINGPPGTGKTTLLRDVVAGLVTKRAQALLKFDDPAKAFTNSGHKIKSSNNQFFDLYELDESLKGFEILIASSNNKAVENISAELPNLTAIAQDSEDLRYFKALSDALTGNDTWGLISAVLGNSTNRNRFREKFWRDGDIGMATYLAEASGYPQVFEDNENHKIEHVIKTRKPQIIQENNPPFSHRDALARWEKARQEFKQALKESQSALSELQTIRQDSQKLEALEKTLQEGQTLEILLKNHKRDQPNVLLRFLKFPSACTWEKEGQRLLSWQNLKARMLSANEKLGSHKIDADLFSKAPEEKNQVSPWCDAKTNALRDNLFTQSIKLHKAFIDAAAKPIRHNLGILMRNFVTSKENIDKKILSFMADLWSSLFLVVPSISTTFASLGNMLDALPPESLEWLLIDEAGQASPQSTVGAILRAKRIIVTGDPLQIKPIETLPLNLIKDISKNFNVDVNRFNAPEASVQTLSDNASAYFTEIDETFTGIRLIGFPLLVHRRCSNPMFGIANKIAYSGLMVQAKKENKSLIRNCLGPSTWFDVQGSSQDKWSPEEGEKVLELLINLKKQGIKPDLYIITPFKIVANNLKKRIYNSRILDSWIASDVDKWLKDHVGTVHTAQGREAEAIILVLGAPRLDQAGVRSWAGGSPNLLNVAVTRAKEALYVVGNIGLWKEAGVFKDLYSRINKI